MVTEDGFHPDRPPIFLSRHAHETAQPDAGTGWALATISSRILKASILAVTVTAMGIAILSVGNPVELVANVTDWLDSNPAPQAEADPSTATIQTIAGTQDALSKTDAPTPREETVAAAEPAQQNQANAAGQTLAESSQRQADAGQSRAENAEPITEELFKQFQAWAAEKEAQAGSAPPVQAAPVRMAQDAPERVRPAKKHRRVHSAQNARAEIRPQRPHARVRAEQGAREQVPPVADPRAPDPSVQNAQTPSLLQSLGIRN